jgi:hypothetical protein
MSAPADPALPERAGTAARGTAWRRCWRRGPWERVSMGLIVLGALMSMQPLSIELFSHSFIVLLAGVVGYSIAGKLP